LNTSDGIIRKVAIKPDEMKILPLNGLSSGSSSLASISAVFYFKKDMNPPNFPAF
jgi:hypothetical protein